MLSITFDVRSEMAGPVVVSLDGSPPFRLTAVTDLTGTDATRVISSDRVLVRFLGDRLMLTLRDLKEPNVVADAYSGTLTLVDDDNLEQQIPIAATCKSTLWYR